MEFEAAVIKGGAREPSADGSTTTEAVRLCCAAVIMSVQERTQRTQCIPACKTVRGQWVGATATLVVTKSLRAVDGSQVISTPDQAISRSSYSMRITQCPPNRTRISTAELLWGGGGALHRESQIQGEGEHITEGPIDQMKCAMFLFKDADLVLEL